MEYLEYDLDNLLESNMRPFSPNTVYRVGYEMIKLLRGKKNKIPIY